MNALRKAGENLSVWLNEALGGPSGYSLCARWYMRKRTSRSARVAAWLSDRVFFYERSHCRCAFIRCASHKVAMREVFDA